ncbi:MAG: 4Fe-4S dicluster domain-containing protein [Deltaproteobacteria bacterium]|jgi:ferredoxin|nr:4Fe-4S dicluster domain-containing protein [Deltaproteobacteria bacterium]
MTTSPPPTRPSPPLLSLRPGPYANRQASFRARHQGLILALAPLLLAWLWLNPGLWLPIALLTSGLSFWVGQRLNPKEKPTFRDLDPWASALASLALTGPGQISQMALMGLGGFLAAYWPQLGRRPGLAAIFGLAFLSPAPPALAFWALLPGALILGLTRIHRPRLALAGVLLAIAIALSEFGWIDGQNLRFLPFILILTLLAPDQPSSVHWLTLSLMGLGPILGGGPGLGASLVLWALTAWVPRRLSRPASQSPISPTSPLINPRREWVARRRCHREKNFPAPLANVAPATIPLKTQPLSPPQLGVASLGLAPPPQACRLASSALACPEACLGLGDCVWACPAQAIEMVPHQAPIVKIDQCLGCGECVAACPQNLMVLTPRTARVLIPCRSLAKPRILAKLCAQGCLGCGRCVRACPGQALSRPEPGPPVINHLRCQFTSDCQMACQAACPRQIPLRLTN